uniref:Membrane-associated kinase regulator 1 n=1 Tax=Puya raimondii TaxID=112807 RepID=A0A8A0WJA1_PUYRA|nr:hypothetical protein PY_022774 [Puya raimondii]
MGRSRGGGDGCRSGCSFPSPPPSSSSSSSDFEFAVSLSPTSKRPLAWSSQQLCPADELFYKGQLLPLQLSPRITMVRALLLASSSSSASSDTTTTTTTTASRDSNGSTSSSFSAELCAADSSARPSSATDDDNSAARAAAAFYDSFEQPLPPHPPKRGPKYLSSFASRFSSVFLHRGGSKKDHHLADLHDIPLSSSSRSTNYSSSSSSTKEVIKKYVKKVKPLLYEKLSSLQQIRQQQQQQNQHQQNRNNKAFTFSIRKDKSAAKRASDDRGSDGISDGSGRRSKIIYMHSNSFSGNLKFPRKKSSAASCPSSMRSSPTHSGLLSIGGGVSGGFPDLNPALSSSSLSSASSSSMEELQSAIQGAIAHCKSSMIQAANFQKKSASAAVSNDD